MKTFFPSHLFSFYLIFHTNYHIPFALCVKFFHFQSYIFLCIFLCAVESVAREVGGKRNNTGVTNILLTTNNTDFSCQLENKMSFQKYAYIIKCFPSQREPNLTNSYIFISLIKATIFIEPNYYLCKDGTTPSQSCSLVLYRLQQFHSSLAHSAQIIE